MTNPLYRAAQLAAAPAFEKPHGATFALGGFVGERLSANVESWLLSAPRANPAMLQMFRDQERNPRRDLLPWSGEFVGKYLISAIQAWRLTRDGRLKALIARVVADLIDAQQPDGYLGPFPSETRLTSDQWDVWGHYHWMLALLMYRDDTGSEAALTAVRKAGDLLHRTFVEGGARMKSPEQNLAILHGACLLYEATAEPTYLELAQWVIHEQSEPDSCGYIEDALERKEIQDFRARRWEGLHCIQGIAELGFITGDSLYHDAFRHIWWEMLKGDRHNTGGFTSGEACQGNPYHQGAIETCCTVAWIALTIDMLRLTGDSRIADELELSTLNGILGAQHPSGRWWTYNTPMDGDRKANAHEIVFQARPGSPELNCCSVNAPRGIGALSEWAVMNASDGVVVNYYGPGTFTIPTPSGSVTIRQETDYPVGGTIRLTVGPSASERFALYVRIPEWSRSNRLSLNGEDVGPVQPGAHHRLSREWADGDALELRLDMSPYFWVGERELEGKTSIFRGPILLTYDRYFNEVDPDAVPALDAAHLRLEPIPWEGWVTPWMLYKARGIGGQRIVLCDYASAGATGTPYRTWLTVEGVEPAPFSREHPKRISRPA